MHSVPLLCYIFTLAVLLPKNLVPCKSFRKNKAVQLGRESVHAAPPSGGSHVHKARPDLPAVLLGEGEACVLPSVPGQEVRSTHIG